MNIVLVTDSDVFAGTERHMLDLATSLKLKGTTVQIACPKNGALGDRASHSGIPVLDLQKGLLQDIWSVIKIAGWLRSKKVDLLHAHNGRSAFLCAIAQLVSGTGSWIYTQHFIETARDRQTGPLKKIKQILHGWLSARARHIVAISNPVRDAIIARGDATASHITVVPNGIPDPLAGSGDSLSTRLNWGVAQDTPLIVCTARLEKEKGLDVLINAMRDVADRHSAARCLILGEGSLHAELQTQITNLGLDDVVLLKGFHQNVYPAVQAADVFVLPSHAEPFGLSIIEAMALGKPVVVSSAGGPKEIVVENITGFKVPPGDSKAFAAAILKLIESKELNRTLGSSGRQRFLDEYISDQMAARMNNVYKRVLDISQHTRPHTQKIAQPQVNSLN